MGENKNTYYTVTITDENVYNGYSIIGTGTQNPFASSYKKTHACIINNTQQVINYQIMNASGQVFSGNSTCVNLYTGGSNTMDYALAAGVTLAAIGGSYYLKGKFYDKAKVNDFNKNVDEILEKPDDKITPEDVSKTIEELKNLKEAKLGATYQKQIDEKIFKLLEKKPFADSADFKDIEDSFSNAAEKDKVSAKLNSGFKKFNKFTGNKEAKEESEEKDKYTKEREQKKSAARDKAKSQSKEPKPEPEPEKTEGAEKAKGEGQKVEGAKTEGQKVEGAKEGEPKGAEEGAQKASDVPKAVEAVDAEKAPDAENLDRAEEAKGEGQKVEGAKTEGEPKAVEPEKVEPKGAEEGEPKGPDAPEAVDAEKAADAVEGTGGVEKGAAAGGGTINELSQMSEQQFMDSSQSIEMVTEISQESKEAAEGGAKGFAEGASKLGEIADIGKAVAEGAK